MIQNNQPVEKKSVVEQPERAKRPNEQGSISVTGFVKIFDPTTKETFVEIRA